jgi:hypothetical protein
MARDTSSIPFTADGWIEAVTVRETNQTPKVAWENVLAETPYLTAEDRDLGLRESRLVRAPAAYKAGFHIAPDLYVVVIQGGWWYRGVTAVQPDGDGARITHIVVNIAPGWTRWIAHLFQARRHRALAK